VIRSGAPSASVLTATSSISMPFSALTRATSSFAPCLKVNAIGKPLCLPARSTAVWKLSMTPRPTFSECLTWTGKPSMNEARRSACRQTFGKRSVSRRLSSEQRHGVAAGVSGEEVDEVGVQAAALQAASGVDGQQPAMRRSPLADWLPRLSCGR
jgi:hypothetical protein